MNPYDKYSSESELPRLTDDMIRGRLKKSFLASFAFSLFMLGAILLAAGVFTAAPISIKNHTVMGKYPVYPVISWVIVVVIWLVAGGFIAYFSRDFLKDCANSAPPIISSRPS